MMKKIAVTKTRSGVRRFMAGLLCLAMLCALAPAVTLEAKAAGWAQPYMDQLTEWGILRGEGVGRDPDEFIPRSEFVTLLNRAFGYKLTGDKSYIPFTDVSSDAWYYDDIQAAYDIGYFTGVPGGKALPNDNLTRAQAVVAIGRNLMLEEEPGEVHEFSDGHNLLPWARGMVKAAYKAEIINGNPGGSFQPNQFITRGEMACLLVKAVGTLVQGSGENELGNVYGNVTINSSGVTLKNTTVAGNLYLTGGISLGEVTLDNVRVLGKIVVSGAGEAHEGDTSVTMRNVTADEMVVDSVADQFVTVKVQGISDIGLTRVRTPAYLQDMTGENYGMKVIDLEAEDSTTLQLVGNIKKVVNHTPYSQITVAQGTVDNLTVDEEAIDSRLDILNGGRVKQLSLDVGTTVAGRGDIDHVDVAASGVTVAQLPNTITVRPGLESNIAGEVMDTVAADESSQDPRLLPGYPNPANIAPTTADLVFSTNKRGTIYWVLTNLADASASADDVINPPKTDRILQSGSIAATASNTEYKASVSRLVADGSYYVTAVLVDSRGQRSPVKVAAFTTPDNTLPAFASGYPKVTLTTRDSIQVGVMPNKSCQLYYAIMNKGATAPTVQQFRAGAISGDLGHGVRDVTKNTIDVFTVNNRSLLELNDYVVYLCLVDADGGKASRVVTLNTKTADGTPPVFVSELQQNKTQPTSVGLTGAINEKGTVYWVAVEAGTGYPAPLPGTSVRPALDSETAKSQVINGMNCLKSGKVSATANKPFTITISGLTAQKAYDVYYLAVDSATPTANMSESVKKLTVRTEDSTGPKVEQYFTDTNEQGLPMPESDIRLIFDESIQIHPDVELEGKTPVLKTAYDDMAAAKSAMESGEGAGNYETLKNDYEEKEKHFTSLLRNYLALMDGNDPNSESVPVFEKTADREEEKTTGADGKPTNTDRYDWSSIDWVDYRKVVVEEKDGKTTVIFKNGEAVRLSSGATYFFRAVQISDTSSQFNRLGKTGTGSVPTTYDYTVRNSMLPQFTTATAQILVGDSTPSARPTIRRGVASNGTVCSDMFFRLTPKSTGAVMDSVYYDVIIWSDTTVSFDLYGRVMKKTQTGGSEPVALTTTVGDKKTAAAGTSLIGAAAAKTTPAPSAGNNWIYLGAAMILTSGQRSGTSLNDLIQGRETFCRINELPADYFYEFSIEVTGYEGNNDRKTWDETVELYVDVAAGPDTDLGNLAIAPADRWGKNEKVSSIGTPESFRLYHTFTNETVPTFASGTPAFDTVDGTSTEMNMRLQFGNNMNGTVYYGLCKVEKKNDVWAQPSIPVTVEWKGKDGTAATSTKLMVLPEEAKDKTENDDGTIKTPANVGTPSNYKDVDPGFYVAPKSGEGYDKLGYGVDGWDPAKVASGENKYALSAPTYTSILNQTIKGSDIMWGPREGLSVGTGITEKPLTGLDPNTTYYIYFILKGKSSAQSPVYVYQFTTPPAQKPVITLQSVGTGTGGNRSSEGVSIKTAASARLYYVLMNTTADKPTTLFNAFEPEGTGWTDTIKNGYDEKRDGVSKTFSVLDALLNNAKAGEGEGSVFDVYADRNLRDDVREFITSEVGGVRIEPVSTMNFAPDRSGNIAFQTAWFSHEKLPSNSCFCLAVAENEKEGVMAFKAVGDIRKPNTTPPDIQSISVTKLQKSKISAVDSVQLYDATITITFTGTGIYLAGFDSEPKYLYGGGKPTDAPANSVLIEDEVEAQVRPGATCKVSQTGRITNAITLDLKNISSGNQIQLFKNGWVGNINGYSLETLLFISFSDSEYLHQEGQTEFSTPRFTINWSKSNFDKRVFDRDGEITNNNNK